MTTAESRTSKGPQLGREYPPEGEITLITRMISELKEQLRELYPEGETLRQAHPKMHGLLKARFIVEPDLPENLRVGVFAASREYAALIRFSNSSTHVQNDAKKDIRGMAIKLTGVEGEKLLNQEQNAKTQDFVLINTETFISKNVSEFSRTIKAITKNSKLAMLFYALNPMNWPVLYRTIRAFSKTGSLFEISYFSTTPYQFGNQDTAVKYACIPVDPAQTPVPSDPDENYLKYQMIAALKKQEIKFNFCVQFQEDPVKMPIENAAVKWDSPFITLATIIIPQQEFDSDAQITYGNSLSFTPWHSLAEHRPIGGLNRARKLVYEHLSEFRHKSNSENQTEPETTDIPN